MANSTVSRLDALLPLCLRVRNHITSTPPQIACLRQSSTNRYRNYATEAVQPTFRIRKHPAAGIKQIEIDHAQQYAPARTDTAPPTLSEIRSTLPKTRKTHPTSTKLVGTVTRTGTMRSAVQVTISRQNFDQKFRRHFAHAQKLMVHEPTGYLRTGDLVEIARFSPATMGTRFETGRLDRRGGGTRYEVHRVITPYVEAVAERKELQGKGELWERFGVVEFERRTKEMKLWYNRRDPERMMALLEGMVEAVRWEIGRIREQLGLRPYVKGEELAESLGDTLGEVAARIRELKTETFTRKPAVV